MRVWVYTGQHDLQIDVMVFSEKAEGKAREYASKEKQFYGKRLVYTLDLLNAME